MLKQCYRILDVGVSIESDSEEFLGLFDDDYSWYKTTSFNVDKRLNCLVNLNKDEKNTFVKVNNRVYPLNGHPNKYSYVYGAIINSLTEEAEDYLLIHSGVAARDGRGVIIAGPCGVGKSTLTLKLLDSGFKFYSDEYCPIHKETGLVHPFLRSVWTSPKIQSVLNSATFALRPRTGKTALRNNKVLIKPDDIKSFITDKPCKAKALICIDPESDTSNNIYHLYLYIKECETEITGNLKCLKGVKLEKVDTEFSRWRIKCPRDKETTEKIKEIFDRHKQHIWDVSQVSPVKADYSKEPVLARITKHEAMFSLLSDMKHKPITKPEGDSMKNQPSPGRFFMESYTALAGVDCYRLSIGRLAAMRDLVLETVK